MRHVRMLGLCLLAALAVCAYAVSSASALPEWGKCEAKAGGKYSDSSCTVKAKKGTGAYEWLKATQVAAKRKAEGKSANIPFSGESVGGGGVLTTTLRECNRPEGVENEGTSYRTTREACAKANGKEKVFSEETTNVECAKEKNTGEAEGKNKIANVEVVFTGCVIYGSIPCHSEGGAEGEIATDALKGKLGYISKSSKEVGVLLEPQKKHGAFATFKCAFVGLEANVGVGNKKEGAEYTSSGCYGVCPGTTPADEKNGGYDGIISPITPVNQMTKEFKQVYTQEAAYPHKNIPSHFEGKHLEVLEDYVELGTETEPPNTASSGWSAAGEVITNVNKPEEEGEIKA